MATALQIANRWRYLRELLSEQLAHFEAGTLRIHTGVEDVSDAAIERVKKEIQEFDALIRESERRKSKGR